MAPSRGRATGKTTAPARSTRQSGRGRVHTNEHVPEVYQSLLADANHEYPLDEPPLKRRRGAAGKDPESAVAQSPSPRESTPAAEPPACLQTVHDSSESSESEDDGFDFEDVDIEHAALSTGESDTGIQDLSISMQSEGSPKDRTHIRRKPLTGTEKSYRLLVHKLHILCLLGHCMFVNGWCKNETAQRRLRSTLSSKTLTYLKPSPTESQFQRNRSFMDGLQQAVDTFTAEYRVLASGLMRPHWEGSGEVNGNLEPIDGSEFVEAAKSLEGSQDLGNQLFCALLRSAGVDARVVCSLQPLPISTPPKSNTPKKQAPSRILAYSPKDDQSTKRNVDEDPAVSASATIGKVPAARRRLGQPSFTDSSKTSIKQTSKPVKKLTHPNFWVEAFNEALQKWVPVDPMVTHTVNQPGKLEPPISSDLSQLTYVIAFETDGSARDVTRRYARAYNGKTRRYRIDSSPDGGKWWKKVMRMLRRRHTALDRDQVEDSELGKREEKEGMPNNVIDFKGHPHYALERHLRRHEVIHPQRQIGKVNAGTASRPRMESVYRRKDVQSCKSADRWYRIGREVKKGEQPLKHVPSRSRNQRSAGDKDVKEMQTAHTALYAPYQTQAYVPPAVQKGRIPKNAYGNLDIYVPSMIPSGAVHVRHAFTQRAARLLRIDYANAVTGFKFQGSHGTAVVEGSVVAEQYADAVNAVIEGFEYEVLQEESRARSLSALRSWKHFETVLRIAERVREYADEKATDNPAETGKVGNAAADFAESTSFLNAGQPLLTAGQYTLSELVANRARAVKQKRKGTESNSEADEHDISQDVHDAEGEGGFFPDANVDLQGGFVLDADQVHGSSGLNGDVTTRPELDDHSRLDEFIRASEFSVDGKGGGFLPSDHDCDEQDVENLSQDGRHESKSSVEQAARFEHPRESSAKGTNDADLQGGFRSDADEEGTTHAVIHNTDRTLEQTPKRTSQSYQRGPLQQLTSPKDVLSGPKDEHQDMTGPADNGSDDDGSLISHDPEDDDAEPDWLESD